jgi:hypothetical protein
MKGQTAAEWDATTLRNEQFNVAQPIMKDSLQRQYQH